MSYTAPLKDMLFAMHELAGLDAVNALPGCEDATADTVEAVLEETREILRQRRGAAELAERQGAELLA